MVTSGQHNRESIHATGKRHQRPISESQKNQPNAAKSSEYPSDVNCSRFTCSVGSCCLGCRWYLIQKNPAENILPGAKAIILLVPMNILELPSFIFPPSFFASLPAALPRLL